MNKRHLWLRTKRRHQLVGVVKEDVQTSCHINSTRIIMVVIWGTLTGMALQASRASIRAPLPSLIYKTTAIPNYTATTMRPNHSEVAHREDTMVTQLNHTITMRHLVCVRVTVSLPQYTDSQHTSNPHIRHIRRRRARDMSPHPLMGKKVERRMQGRHRKARNIRARLQMRPWRRLSNGDRCRIHGEKSEAEVFDC